MIRPVTERDIQDICEIYNYYVENTAISFEENRVSINEMEQRILNQSIDYPWLVYELDGKVVAFAYANKWKARSAYRFTLESTIYLSSEYQGKGIGTKLYQKLFDELATRSIRSIMAVIALPNTGSIALHEKMGFEKVAHFKEVGYKYEQWIDVGYWQKMFD
ncbi:MAG: N-acetyltransferase family protein [Cocleimonas sp.]|nr:N-acetyltransferase family protein [Cocleimonas sp.]